MEQSHTLPSHTLLSYTLPSSPLALHAGAYSFAVSHSAARHIPSPPRTYLAMVPQGTASDFQFNQVGVVHGHVARCSSAECQCCEHIVHGRPSVSSVRPGLCARSAGVRTGGIVGFLAWPRSEPPQLVCARSSVQDVSAQQGQFSIAPADPRFADAAVCAGHPR